MVLVWLSRKLANIFYLHDKEREELVVLVDLPGLDGVAVVVEGVHDHPAVGTQQEQPADTEDVEPKSSEEYWDNGS